MKRIVLFEIATVILFAAAFLGERAHVRIFMQGLAVLLAVVFAQDMPFRKRLASALCASGTVAAALIWLALTGNDSPFTLPNSVQAVMIAVMTGLPLAAGAVLGSLVLACRRSRWFDHFLAVIGH